MIDYAAFDFRHALLRRYTKFHVVLQMMPMIFRDAACRYYFTLFFFSMYMPFSA